MNDTIQPGTRRGRRFGVAGAVALVFVLLLAAIVSAAWVTINTDNAAVDGAWSTAWPTPPYFDACQTPTAPDNRYEIRNAWFANDGTYLYFRIETCGGLALHTESAARAIGAIDCNNDGDFEDGWETPGPVGDRLIIYFNDGSDRVLVTNGQGENVREVTGATFAEKVGANIEWKVPIDFLYPDCRASTSNVNIAWTTVKVNPTPTPADILDSSKTTLTWSNPIDYGDLVQGYDDWGDCAEYRTLLKCDGARHGLGGDLRLGAAVDPDGGDLSDAAASADDTTGATPDDEDGVWPTQGVNWAVGANGGSLDVTVSGGSGYLSCWIDWGNNSNFTDANDLVILNRVVSAGTAAQTFAVPSGVTFPNTFNVRCRVYPNSIASPVHTGAIEFGEVEDHQWAFGAGGAPPAPPAAPVAVTTLAIAQDGISDVLLTWTHNTANEAYRVLRDATDPYFAPGDADTDLGTVSAAPWEKLDTGVYGLPVETYYYIVLGRVGSTESGPSNRVGLFEFGLTSGD